MKITSPIVETFLALIGVKRDRCGGGSPGVAAGQTIEMNSIRRGQKPRVDKEDNHNTKPQVALSFLQDVFKILDLA